MAKQLDTKIELARWYGTDSTRQTITIQDYRDFLTNQDKASIAEFIYQRLHSRYLKPFLFPTAKYKKEFKNGFSVMANCCLLIETLQSFVNGWGDSNQQSKKAFVQFFASEAHFFDFKDKANEFYSHVRCGILHQGETTGGWTITREGKDLFDEKTHKINSVCFAQEMEKSLKNYSDKLKSEAWDSEIWDNFRTKMRQIIANCEK